VLGGFPATRRPDSLSSVDLEGDGDLDLVSANEFGNDLTAFRQLTPARFDPVPLVLGGFPTTSRPESLVVVDLDGDGDPDLLTANANGDDLTVFWGGR
jgi:hypothetical protein